MCLLVLAWQAAPRYRLVVAANRDEYHERPAAALAKWPPPAALIAGRDLRAQGAWLAVDRERRFGVVTNFRELQPPRLGAPSRGELIPRYLNAPAPAVSAQQFFAALEGQAQRYSGFNLLLTDRDSLWYGSNRASPFARPLSAGVYGLSNELLDTPWPKLQRVRRGFEAWLAGPQPRSPSALFGPLNYRTQAADDGALPRRGSGLPQDWDRIPAAPLAPHPPQGAPLPSVRPLDARGRP